ncbi:MAG: MBL fold metallo-hydrolase [Anaerolineae bacterium]|nr:MBL fold metallo-hydrolase [Anaerolineae bacterium]
MAYVHLFVGTEAVLLMDTCCAHNPHQDILPYMAQIGITPDRLTYIVISHSDLDHQGGCQPMKEAAPQAILLCHNLDRPWVEDTEALIAGRYMQFDTDHGYETSEETKQAFRHDTLSHVMDMTVEGGEHFRLSPDWYIELIHTPGHTWGHLALYDPRSKTMAANEAALWSSILDTDWNPALPPTYCYVDTYLSTIARLLSMDIETYSPAHWPVQRGTEVSDFLRESRNYCLHVESRLLTFAQEHGPFTLKEAVLQLGSQLGCWPDDSNDMLTFPFSGNLNRLTQRGLLSSGRSATGLMEWRSL